MNRIDINNRYIQDDEIRTDMKPYLAYFNCLQNTFSVEDLKSVCDIGCSTGHVLYYLKNKYNSDIKGYEYFDYHKTSEHCKIPEHIDIFDMRDHLNDNVKKYNIVNCTEVGEHIDKEYADTLIENAKKLSNKYIIFTWSSHGGEAEPNCDPHHQHLNPLSRDQYLELMNKHNLKPNMNLTNTFLKESFSHPSFYFWWRESFVVWEI
jgi:hypothetical protein